MSLFTEDHIGDALFVDALWSHPSRLFSGDNGGGAVSTCIEWLNGANIAGDEDGVQYLVGITGTPTTTTFRGDSSAISSTDNAYATGTQYVLFISGVNAGQKRLITGYTGATKEFVCDAFPHAPGSTDQFYILKIPGVYDIQNQRYAGRLITAGVATNDAALIHKGFKLITFALQYLQADGTPFRSADNWHQTSIFLEEVLRGVGVLEASSLDTTPYRRAIEALRETAARWVRWMLSSSASPGYSTGRNRNWPYSHRRFLCAAAWLWVWQYTGDSGILQHALDFINEGLNWQFPSSGAYAGTYQRVVSGTPYYAAGDTIADVVITNTDHQTQTVHPDGIWPELWNFTSLPAGQAGGTSGWDVSYQNSSIRFACICHDLLPASYSSLKSSLVAAVQRGAAFERQLLRSNNLLEAVGSTRIGNGDLTPSGAPKGINYFDAFEAFMMAANLTDTATNRQFANKLAYGQNWVSSLGY